MKKKGFTLIEMLVAIGIFSVFMGVLITSYMSIVKGLRGAEEYRELYADARNVFDTILENARNSTIYGKACDNNLNGGDVDLKTLKFCSTDGTTRVTFRYTEPVLSPDGESTDGESEKTMGTLEMTVGEVTDLLSASNYMDGDSSTLNSDGVNISSFSFTVFPTTDPFGVDYENTTIPYQPVVIVEATFEKESVSGTTYSLPLRTAISLRTYN